MSDAILIVEDNQVNRMILRTMLRKHGYDPLIAQDGIEGVEMAAIHRPRLVLMDLNMPRMDGIAAAAEIRRRAGSHGMAIIAVTANASDAQRDACAAAGFEGMLPKPLDMTELIQTVSKWLGKP